MKKTVLPILSVMAAMALVGCGPKNESKEASKSTPAASESANGSSSKAADSSSKSQAASSAASKSQAASSAASNSQATSSTSTSQGPAYVEPTAYTWEADGDKNGLVNPEKATEDATKKAYRLDIADSTGDYKDKSQKMKSNAEWAVSGIPNGKYALQIACKMTNSSHTDRYWYNMALAGNETKTRDQDTVDQDPFRYFFAFNGTQTVNPNTDKNWGQQNLNTSDYKAVYVVDSVDLNNVTKVELKHGNIGYSLYVEYVRLVKVA